MKHTLAWIAFTILRLVFVFGLLVQFPTYGQSYKSPYDYEIPRRFIGEPKLEDGVYSATVKYYNSSTRTRSSYTLDVEVEHNRVVVIYFDSGGQLHSGENSSGYDYSGGYLKVETYNKKPVSARTKVNIVKGYSEFSYEIIIEGGR